MRIKQYGADAPLWLGDRSLAAAGGANLAPGFCESLSGQWGSPVWPSDPRLAVGLSAPVFAQQSAGPLHGGGERSSGAGPTDGRHVGPFGGRDADGGPRFDQQVQPGGYLWWYVDALSDDGNMVCPSSLLWAAFFHRITLWREAFKVALQIRKISAL